MANLKITPLTLHAFIFAYNLELFTKLEKIRAYCDYLQENADDHHYGIAETLENWYAYECNMFEN